MSKSFEFVILVLLSQLSLGSDEYKMRYFLLSMEAFKCS